MFYRSLLFCAILCFIFAPPIFAQGADISGKYEGTADTQSYGKLKISAEIRSKQGKLSGVLHTPLGDAGIIEGAFADNKFSLVVDASGDDLLLSGTRGGDGKLTGTVTGATVTGIFELNRTGDLEPEKDYSVVLHQSKEKWREDLKFLSEELPKSHKNAFHLIAREQFEKKAADLDAKIPTLSDDEIAWEMAALVSRIGDGHTGLEVASSYLKIPMQLYWFGKELRVIRVSGDLPRLNGARLVGVGGVPVEKIYEQSRNYIPQGESEQFVLNSSTYLYTYPVFLKIIGAAKDNYKAVYEFIDVKGKKFHQELIGVSQGEKIAWIRPFKAAPLYLQKEDESLTFTYLKDAQTVYVNFRWYPRRAAFAKFSRELFDFIDKNPVEKLVIDMRHNGGGDFTRGRDYLVKQIKERKKFLERGHLFVIAGRITFSAGMSNTADFKKDLGAFLVGEPTGARPNGYQEGRGISLPNSHLWLGYSIEFYKFADQDTPGILPDKRIEPDWRSYQAGRDPALEWILNFRN